MITAATILTLIGLALVGRLDIVTSRAKVLMKDDWWPFILLVGAMVFLFLIRLPLAFQHMAFGDDMASYLTTYNWVNGWDPTWPKEAHARTPLAGVALYPFVKIFGATMGSKILAIGTSVAWPLAFYFMVRLWLRPWVSLVASLAVSVLPLFALYTYGGFVPVLALLPALVLVRVIVEAQRGNVPFWIPMFPAIAMGGINQTIIPIAAFVAGILVLAQRERAIRGIVVLTLAMMAAVLPWLYFLWPSLPFGGGLTMTFPDRSFVALLIPGFDFGHGGVIYREYWYYAYAVPLVILATGHLANLWKDKAWQSVSAVAVVTGLWCSMVAADVGLNITMYRSGYIVPLMLAVLIGMAFQKMTRRLAWPTVLVCVGIASLAGAWNWNFNNHAQVYHILEEREIPVLEWIGENTPEDAHVFGHPRGLAYWVGAWSPRMWSGTWGKPLVGREDEADAMWCAFGWRTDCDPYRWRDMTGIDYVVIDPSSPQLVYGAPDDQWHMAGHQPWFEPIYQHDTITVYKWR